MKLVSPRSLSAARDPKASEVPLKPMPCGAGHPVEDRQKIRWVPRIRLTCMCSAPQRTGGLEQSAA